MRLIDTQPCRPLPWGLAWYHRMYPAHTGSAEPFAATHDEALAVCRQMDQEFPDLHHWPVIVAGRPKAGAP
jgi:hypothetical protein